MLSKTTPAQILSSSNYSLLLLLACLLLSACSNNPLTRILKPEKNEPATTISIKKAKAITQMETQEQPVLIDTPEEDSRQEPLETVTDEMIPSEKAPVEDTQPQLHTIKVLDIHSGEKSSDPAQLVAAGQGIYFSADDGEYGRELWISDKRGSKIKLIKDINAHSVKPSNITTIKTDNAFPSSLTANNDIIFFAADDSLHGKELWRSDGTEAGTYLVKDIAPSNEDSTVNSSHPTYLTVSNNRLFFVADDGNHGKELWSSDGSEENTFLVKDINTISKHSSPTNLTSIDGIIYFSANDGIHGYELWKSDGTSAGTVMIKDINQSDSAYPSGFIGLNNLIYFIANDGVYGKELWRTDGTAAGTRMVKNINTSQGVNDGKSIVSGLYQMNNYLFFAADDAINGTELWRSDGTMAGTMMVRDINPGSSNSMPGGFIQVASTLYFAANDGSHGIELWQTDGRPTGTRLVKDINTNNAIKSGSSYPTALTDAADQLFFVADDGSGGGEELWVSNGTTSGTRLFFDISLDNNTNAGGSNPRDLIYIDKTLFFSAYRKNIGRELFSISTQAAQLEASP